MGRLRSPHAPQCSNLSRVVGPRNPTVGAPGRGASDPLFRRLTRLCSDISMADAPRAHIEHWVVQTSSAAPTGEKDLHSALLAARIPPGATGRGGRAAQTSPLALRRSRAAARSANYAAATAPYSCREQANMRVAVIVARELLRCRLLESGRDALR